MDIEDTLKGLKYSSSHEAKRKSDHHEKQAAKNDSHEQAFTKKTSISNFQEFVGVLQNSPNIQIIDRKQDEQRVSLLDPLTNQEIEIQLKGPLQQQKSKEDIIQDIKENKVASIVISEKVNDSTQPTSNENNNLKQNKISIQKSPNQQLQKQSSKLSKEKAIAAQEEIKEKKSDKKKKAVGFNIEDIAREMQSAGRKNDGNQSQDEKSEYENRSIKSERAPKSIIKKKYSDTQSCYGGNGDTESVKSSKKKKVKWSKEVQNKTKRKKKASFY